MLFQIFVIFCIISLNNIVCVSADINSKLAANVEPLARRSEAGFLDNIKSFWSSLKCGGKLLLEFNSCQKEADDYWKDVENSDRVKCCSAFDVIYCLIKKAKEMCDPEVAEEIAKDSKEAMDKSTENECKAFGHRWYDWKTFKCRIPWLEIAILIAAIAAVIIVGIVLCRLF